MASTRLACFGNERAIYRTIVGYQGVAFLVKAPDHTSNELELIIIGCVADVLDLNVDAEVFF